MSEQNINDDKSNACNCSCDNGGCCSSGGSSSSSGFNWQRFLFIVVAVAACAVAAHSYINGDSGCGGASCGAKMLTCGQGDSCSSAESCSTPAESCGDNCSEDHSK